MDHKHELRELIETLIRENASDLHISVGRYPAIRVTGELISLVTRSIPTRDDTTILLKELLLNNQKRLDGFFDSQELDFSYAFDGGYRLRGNAFFQKGQISIALRLVPKVKTLSELHLPPILADFARRRQGFFLVVGPVGQGKSTTLAAMIDLVSSERAEHIITIEDPIEHIYEQKHAIIDQREIGIDTRDFHSALKSAFREDVNVLMVGEMRTPETMSAAVTAAETGHLVLSTLHTNNASQTIDRIVDSFPPGQQDQIRAQLSSSLIGIFSERLIPRITGGLVPAYELLINNNAVSNLIRENRTHEIDVVIETGFELGMVDMNRSLLDLVRAGEITMDSARAFSLNPKALERLI